MFEKRKYSNYSIEDLKNAVLKCKSISCVLKELGLKPAGGNFNTIKRKLQTFKINTEHFTGSTWNKDQQLKDWSDYTRASALKPHLIKERGLKCEM